MNEIVRLALEEDIGSGDVTTNACLPADRRARGRDVVVLDQNRVPHTHAMVGDTAGGCGLLFQNAKPRRGLARIQHLAARPRHGIGMAARGGGHAA